MEAALRWVSSSYMNGALTKNQTFQRSSGAALVVHLITQSQKDISRRWAGACWHSKRLKTSWKVNPCTRARTNGLQSKIANGYRSVTSTGTLERATKKISTITQLGATMSMIRRMDPFAGINASSTRSSESKTKAPTLIQSYFNFLKFKST